MNIKKNDTVIVLSGKDKGVKGKVLVAMPAENKVIVERSTSLPATPSPAVRARPVASSRRRPPSVLARSLCSARSAIRAFALVTMLLTARRSASAASAAPKSEKGALNHGC